MIARKGTKAMAEPTEFTIGTSTSCSDGYCGEVSGVIIDPATRTVTHLVIERKHGREAGRLVPLDLVDSTPAEIRLRCTLAEFGLLDRAEETELVGGVGYGGGGGSGIWQCRRHGRRRFGIRHGDRHGARASCADRRPGRGPAGRNRTAPG